MIRGLRALSFTVFFFGTAGWAYIAGNAMVHPETLSLPLTHLLPFPREDTFGAICFALAVPSCFIWQYLKHSGR